MTEQVRITPRRGWAMPFVAAILLAVAPRDAAATVTIFCPTL